MNAQNEKNIICRQGGGGGGKGEGEGGVSGGLNTLTPDLRLSEEGGLKKGSGKGKGTYPADVWCSQMDRKWRGDLV